MIVYFLNSDNFGNDIHNFVFGPNGAQIGKLGPLPLIWAHGNFYKICLSLLIRVVKMSSYSLNVDNLKADAIHKYVIGPNGAQIGKLRPITPNLGTWELL